jgi:Leu/Phe-tRNA-protein transferase
MSEAFLEEDENEVEDKAEYESGESEVPEVVRIESWHISHPRILKDIVEDMHHFLYLTDDWSPEFYVKQAYEGFVAVAYEDIYLLPEMQRSYAMIDLKSGSPLHVGKSLKKKLRKYPQPLSLTFNTALDAVIKAIDVHHAGRNWLQSKYGELAKELMSQGNIVVSDSNFRFISAELWAEHGNLVAGEVGYAIGNVYTSLTGFRTSSASRLAFGSVQLLALGKVLKQAGFTLWNLGHPPRGKAMRYKTEMGGQVLPRSAFLQLWRQAREGNSSAVEKLLLKSHTVVTSDLLLSSS